MGIAWVVLSITDSVLWVGLVIGVASGPALIGSLFGGVAADRTNRRTILVLARLCLAALAILTGMLIGVGAAQGWHLLIIGAAVGTVGVFVRPASTSYIVDLVPARKLINANGLMSATGSTGDVVAAIVGGWVIAAGGADLTFYATGVLLVIAAFLTLRIHNPGMPISVVRRPILSEMADGVRAAKSSPVILGVISFAFLGLFSEAITPMMVVYSRDVLGTGAFGLGMMSASLGAGMFAGSVIATFLGDPPRKALIVVTGIAVWDGAMAGFAFSPYFPLSLVLLFTMGIGSAISTAVTITIIQVNSPPEMRGKVLALWGMTAELAPLGILLAAGLATLTNNWLPLVLGAGIELPIALLIFARSPGLRAA